MMRGYNGKDLNKVIDLHSKSGAFLWSKNPRRRLRRPSVANVLARSQEGILKLFMPQLEG